MLKELRLLLSACPPGTDYEGFRQAVVDNNVLLKNTETTRKESFRRLRELYALDEEALIFRALRDLWTSDPQAEPVIALLCATARDAILRGTADLILTTPYGESVTPQMIEQATEESFPHRYNATMLANVGRHAASSWQQSGHLQGRLTKKRVQAKHTPAAVAYAFFLGHLCEARGDALFRTLWSRLLDTTLAALHESALAASRRGWLEYRHSGSVTEIAFRYLMRDHVEKDGV
ncbi:MAG: hypothetical protein H3C34_24550 [Caldilineaceae bacterium]|nr:hypothetical protein [Caldilineaceae bacterium]